MTEHTAGILSLLIAAENTGNMNSITTQSAKPTRVESMMSFVTTECQLNCFGTKRDGSSLCRGESCHSSPSSVAFSNSSAQDSIGQRKRKPPLHFSRILPPKKRRMKDESNHCGSDNSTATTVATIFTDISSVAHSSNGSKSIANGKKKTSGPSTHITKKHSNRIAVLDNANTNPNTCASRPIISPKYFQAAKIALAESFHREQRALALSSLRENSQMAMKEAGLPITMSCVSMSSRDVFTSFNGNEQGEEAKTQRCLSLMWHDELNSMQQMSQGHIVGGDQLFQVLSSSLRTLPKSLHIVTSNLAKRSLYEAYLNAVKAATH